MNKEYVVFGGLGVGVLYFARKWYVEYEQKKYCKDNPGACGTDCLKNPDDPGCTSLFPPQPAPSGNNLPLQNCKTNPYMAGCKNVIPGKNKYDPQTLSPNQRRLATTYCWQLSMIQGSVAGKGKSTSWIVDYVKAYMASILMTPEDKADWDCLNAMNFNTLRNSCNTCYNPKVLASLPTP